MMCVVYLGIDTTGWLYEVKAQTSNASKGKDQGGLPEDVYNINIPLGGRKNYR